LIINNDTIIFDLINQKINYHSEV